MMLSSVCFLQHFIAVKEIKMMKQDTLFILMKTVLCEYGHRLLKNGQGASQKYFLENVKF